MSITPLPLTYGRTARIWRAFLWRATLLGLLVGGVAGFFMGMALVILKLPWDPSFAGSLAGQIMALPVSFFVLRWVLQIKFKDFSIRLIPNDALSVSEEVIQSEPTDSTESSPINASGA